MGHTDTSYLELEMTSATHDSDPDFAYTAI